MSTSQRMLVLLVLVAFASVLRGEPPAAGDRKPPRTDRFGDPLPDGALARLGSARLRHGSVVKAIAVSPDGTALAAVDETKCFPTTATASFASARVCH
jgi:hypothetical protein